MTKARVAVAVSGGGRTLANLLAHEGLYEIAGIISSSPKALANQKAVEAGIPLLIADFSQNQTDVLDTWLKELQIDWIALAGFLKPFPSLSRYAGRIVNIHPALLPRYGGKGMYGMHVHRAVFQAGEALSGPSVHFVNEHYDEGGLIAQYPIPIAGLESPEAIAEAVFAAECALYPKALDALVSDRLPKSGLWIAKKEEL